MNITVASVVYLEALMYLNDLFQSLISQDFEDFDILLINDNIPGDILKKELKDYDKRFLKRIIIVDKNSKQLLPFELRIEMLNEALDRNTDLLILADCDDKLMINRVSETIQQYDSGYTFFYNELLDFDGNKVMPDLPETTDSIESILERNYLGLSNCALNMKHVSKEFVESLADGRTPIFDWYMFSRILLDNGKGKRIDDTATYYRIHGNNIAGIPDCTITELYKEKHVKLEHYRLLEKYDNRCSGLMKKYQDIDISQKYCETHNKIQFWWNMLT